MEFLKKTPAETIAALGLMGIAAGMAVANVAIRHSLEANIWLYEKLGEDLGNFLFLQGGDLGTALLAPGLFALASLIYDKNESPEEMKQQAHAWALVGSAFGGVVFGGGEILEVGFSDIPDLLTFSIPLMAFGVEITRLKNRWKNFNKNN